MRVEVSQEEDSVRFPKVDRSVVRVGRLFEESDEKAYWHERTIAERLEAVELYRVISYGQDACTARLQRVLEFAEFPPR